MNGQPSGVIMTHDAAVPKFTRKQINRQTEIITEANRQTEIITEAKSKSHPHKNRHNRFTEA